MNKLKNTCALLILVVFLTMNSLNTNNSGIIMIQGAVAPTLESDIVIGIDMAHNNNISVSQLTNLTTLLNTTFSSTQVVFLKNNINSGELSRIDVLVVFAPTIEFTETEIEDVENFIKNGNSMMVATGYMNQSTEYSNDILSVFGLSFNMSSSVIPEIVTNNKNITIQYSNITRDFTTPITPITENISQIIFPNGVGISFNKSKLESYDSPAITYFNPVLLMNASAEVSENNTLASTLEFENGARILTIGSVDLFNNSYIEPLENTSSIFIDNTDFIMNSIRWLGRNTGIMNFYEPWTDHHAQSIKLGEIIHGKVTLLNSQNESLTQTQIFVALERTGSYLSSRIMSVDPSNSSKFFGSVNTEGLSSGYCDVVFIANRIGYLPIELRAGRVYLERAFPTPIPPNFAFWGLIIAVIAIFVTTAVFIRMNFKEN
ncbi:MAG: hypothetical protein ACTSQ9_02025 [Candidatus Hodarchaeales archaeon]